MNIVKHSNGAANQTTYPFVLPPLQFDKTALEPYMTAHTFDFHHAKHHNTYVQNLNKLLENSPLKEMDLEHIILNSSQDESQKGIFNNAAQVWNHTFFWHSMKKHGGGKPRHELLSKIDQDFGSFEKFIEDFKAAGVGQFGSGWVWLVFDVALERLKIVKTANADTPLVNEQVALLTCDVWEHAYYLDYQNRRLDFLTTFLEYLANWDFAYDNFIAAKA